jgi:hypothetical protein
LDEAQIVQALENAWEIAFLPPGEKARLRA